MATLPKVVSKATIAQLDPGLVGGFIGLVKRAGLQLRINSDGEVRLRTGGTYPPFFRLVALQGPGGNFLPDAEQRMERGGRALEMDRVIAAHARVQGIQTTLWGEHELRVATEKDTLLALAQLQTTVGPPVSSV